MPEDQAPPDLMGLEDLVTPAAQATNEPPLDLVKLQAEQDQAANERIAAKAAADAEERIAAERLEKAEEPLDTRSEARKINDQIHEQIMKARAKAREDEKPKPPQPVSRHIMEQTRREMEEGARQSAWHKEQRTAALANRPPPVPRPKTMSPIPVPEGNTEVFRPQDYVPDQVKGQGNIKVLS
jgi:hypothetical protein